MKPLLGAVLAAFAAGCHCPQGRAALALPLLLAVAVHPSMHVTGWSSTEFGSSYQGHCEGLGRGGGSEEVSENETRIEVIQFLKASFGEERHWVVLSVAKTLQGDTTVLIQQQWGNYGLLYDGLVRLKGHVIVGAEVRCVDAHEAPNSDRQILSWEAAERIVVVAAMSRGLEVLRNEKHVVSRAVEYREDYEGRYGGSVDEIVLMPCYRFHLQGDYWLSVDAYTGDVLFED